MKSLLIIGGTRFVGRLVIEKLLEEDTDYKITIFNRGITNSTLFKNETNVEFIAGDRETKDIEQLFSKKWDVVIDFMGYFPDSVAHLITHIHMNIDRYIFISTISVYDLENPSFIPIVEQGRLLKCEEKDRKDITWDSYGKRKIACELEIQKFKDLDYIILRPSLIYGKYDYTDRFYYWLYKIKYEEDPTIPNDFIKPVNYTFSEDFANVIIHFIESVHSKNVYNVVTNKSIALLEMMNLSKQYLNSNCTIIPEQKELTSDFEYPLWFPNECLEISSERLNNEFGFNFCSLEESLQKTLNYCDCINWPKPSGL